MKICAMIPALAGGSRLPNKNLILVDGEPMVHYVLRAAKKSQMFSEIYVNSDIPEMNSVAENFGVNFFNRKPDFGGASCNMSNKSASCGGSRCQVHDHYIYDFLSTIDCDYLIQIHTTSPLIKEETISGFVNFMIDEKMDSCFSIIPGYKEVMFGDDPINFSLFKKSQTQDLPPINEISWALSGWKVSTFKKSYEENNESSPGPTFVGKMGFYPISKLEGIDVDTYDDLFIAEACLSHLKRKENCGRRFLTSEIMTIERELDDLIAKDGCRTVEEKTHNLTKNNIVMASQKMGEGSWCYPVIMTDNDQATFIQQVPGEGCRWHNHPTKDEFWVVMQGQFLFEIDGLAPIRAIPGDVVYAKKGINHRITCAGETPGIRFACGERGFAHVYENNEPAKNIEYAYKRKR